jgi:hypothetical protein
VSKTIRYTEHMAPSTASAKRRLQAALKRAKRQHPRWESIEARFIANGSSGPIVVRVEVPA